ncbi:MAG TPA: ISNCY family transposase, partial [Polyangia bacterium]
MAAFSPELLVMSTRELDRLEVIKQVVDGRTTARAAAALLDLSAKQITRLRQAYERDGAAALVSRKRGRPSNRKLAADIEERVVQLVRDRYADFGPTLAREKLAENHGIKLGLETVRQILLRSGVWVPKSQRIARPHQPRYRRECLGELVQIDGCDHHWFEDRAPSCTLLVYVDDATSRLMELRFVESESTLSYFESTASYLRRHGKPVAFYSDKHSTFRVTRQKDGAEVEAVTQFARALSELNIDIICANTPQAKGRVERMHSTLQDRLVKELRLQGISDVVAANAFLPGFLEAFNARFAKPPRNAHDAHRKLDPLDDLDRIFSCREERSMGPDLTVQYLGSIYVVTPGPTTKKLAGRRRKVEIRTWPDGRLEIQHDGQVLPHTVPDEYPYPSPAEIVARKDMAVQFKRMQEAQNDPSRRYALAKRFPAQKAEAKKAHRRRAKPKYEYIPTVERIASTKPGKRDFHDAGERTRYCIRWVRGHAYLHERFFTGPAGREGVGAFQQRYLGRVEDQVARRWERVGEPTLPPPLKGQKLPPLPARRAAKRAQKARAAGSKPPPPPPPSGEERLGVALWYAEVMRSAEVDRIRRQNDAIEKYNDQLEKKLLAQVKADRLEAKRKQSSLRPSSTVGPRKGPHRAPPPRPVRVSAGARAGQGSP